MKRKEEIQQLRDLDNVGLLEKVSSLQEEMMKLRFKHAGGQLEHTAQLGALRKTIARSRTLLRARQGDEQKSTATGIANKV